MHGIELDLMSSVGASNVINVDVPAIDSWQIDAQQWINIPPSNSPFQLIFKDFKFEFKTSLELGSQG